MFIVGSHRQLVRADHEQIIKDLAMAEFAHSHALEQATSPLICLSKKIQGAILYNLNVVPCHDVLTKRGDLEHVVTVDVIPKETLGKWRETELRKRSVAVENITGVITQTTAIPYNTSVLDNDLLVSALLAFIQTSVPTKQRGSKSTAAYNASIKHASFTPALRRKVWNQMLIMDQALIPAITQLRFEGIDAHLCRTFTLEVYVAVMVNRGN